MTIWGFEQHGQVRVAENEADAAALRERRR